MTLHEWFKSIAFALNDDEPGHEFARYPLTQMVQAYNAGVCLVEKYRPDLFTELRIVKLADGRHQDARGCCEKVLDVIEQTDGSGNIITTISGARKTTSKVKRVWKKPSCLTRPDAPSGYVISSADIDKNMDGRFTVEPPVPCDVEAYVRVKCVSPPCPISAADVEGTSAVECVMMTALWYFVLGKMQAGDRFTESPFSNMQYNHRMFFDILGVVEQRDTDIESPEEA